MAAEVARQWREEEEMAPAVRRRAHEARQRHCPVLLLAQEMGEPNARQQILLRLLVNLLANLFRNEIRVGARRFVPLTAPGLVHLQRFSGDELQRLGAGLIAERLPL